MASQAELSKQTAGPNDTKVFSTVNETLRTDTPLSPEITAESPNRVHNGTNVSDIEVQADLDLESTASRCEILASHNFHFPLK